MGDNEPGWDLYRTFLAVLQHGSLSVAGRKLGLTQPTAGRHVAALEAQLGAGLFIRSPRGLVPTEAADSLAIHAEAMAAAALRRAASGDVGAAKGTVRLTPTEPTVGEVQVHLFAQPPFGTNAVAVANWPLVHSSEQ
jgi:DNA-binding transcriptional LysR family regulator